MLRRRDVTVGKYYVKNGGKVAREVLGTNNQTVKFNTHHLDTGNSCGSPSECTRQDFIHWADREALSAEMDSIQFQEMEAMFRGPQSPNWEELEHDIVKDPAAFMLVQKTTILR